MVLLSVITNSRFEMTDIEKRVKKPSKYTRHETGFATGSSIPRKEYEALSKMQFAIPEHAVEYFQNKYCPPGIGERVIADFD